MKIADLHHANDLPSAPPTIRPTIRPTNLPAILTIVACSALRRLGRIAAGAALVVAAAAAAAQPDPWFDAGRRASPAARAALSLLADAASHGLDPADYRVPPLPGADAVPAPAEQAERFARALERALKRYLNDLHDGRVRPGDLEHRFPRAWAEPFDAEAVLRDALAQGDPALAVRRAVPTLPQYERLREALARSRALGDHPAWRQPLPALPAKPRRPARALEPGDAWSGLPLLAARLAALGDLAAEPATPPAVYDPILVDALRAFQHRHGLLEDGVLGAATRAALEVPPARRVRQLELALERLRWTPLLQGPRMVVVNVPEFVLRAYEVVDGRISLRVQSRIVVGKALDTRTPLIGEEMRRIEFQPFWNVPASIARKELVPRLRRDPGHWEREGFEFVLGDGRIERALGEATLQAVLDGRARIRQRPGPRNALGDIKFVFPNREAIYLHHTPAVQLFERARRDYSHGCIRVEQPVALAAFALHGVPGWDEERIRRAMEQDAPSTVNLAEPLPALIAYGTALVKDTHVYFFDDIYGHDRALDEALRRRVPR